MLRLTFTLVADGTSDRALMRVLDWMLRCAAGDCELVARFAEAESRPGELAAKVRSAVENYPCDILFVHRDAERADPEDRREEILRAVRESDIRCHVPVIPVRMTEAWLLIDARAIARAADRVDASCIELPPLADLDSIPDPKAHLQRLLRDAASKTGRRHRRFVSELPSRVQRVAEYIDDFSLLRAIPAFRELERSTREALRRIEEERQAE